MRKSDIATAIAARAGIGRRTAMNFVDLMVAAMISAFLREERIAIRGFGNFTMRRIRACASRNPKTGERITLPERRFPFFKAGKDLLERINNTVGG
ncbi:MAG TPA: HU family DNA-binding protein [bacterium]|nr:HU family DNA-binding protein [bacterium]